MFQRHAPADSPPCGSKCTSDALMRPPFKQICLHGPMSAVLPPVQRVAAGTFMQSICPSSLPMPQPAVNAPSSSPLAAAANKQQRYHSTRAALQQSGLLELTTRMGTIIRNMQQYKADVAVLRHDSHAFLLSVLREPHNARFKEYLLNIVLENFKNKVRQKQQQPSER